MLEYPYIMHYIHVFLLTIIFWIITLYIYICTQPIHVHCRKIYNVFVRALETGRKTSLWRSLSCFAANANECYIFRQCTCVMFILQCQKTQNYCQIVLKKGKQSSF